MRVLLIALALLVGGCSTPAPTPAAAPAFEFTDARRQELLVAREAVWRSWFANDTVQLAALLPANLLAIPPEGDGWQTLKEVLAESRGFAASGGKLVRLEFPRTEIQVFGTVAVVFSSYLFETQAGGQTNVLKGRVTEVFEYVNGRWVNPSWHMDNDG
ncbi:MAG: nuclear transport factor 2 family protein [Gemmatimonadetes bacterium]|nr:nuclear transport factor 2 family protein [Gemmatimonadota bacterium]